MNTGMLWQSQKPIEERVAEAVAYYQKKYGHAPDSAFANPKLLNGRDVIVSGVSVRPMRIPVSLLWIGVEDAAAGLERASGKLLEMAEETRCAWDDAASPEFDGCAGCDGACGFKTQTGQLTMFAESKVLA